jgi:4-amino-4-deoxy-L-arabinose transferase-like glycosyltransferase
LVLHFDLARRLWSRKAAFWSSLALLLCVQFTLQGRTAQIDAVLAFCTTLGLYGLLRHLLLGPAWGWYVIGGIATGVGCDHQGHWISALAADDSLCICALATMARSATL